MLLVEQLGPAHAEHEHTAMQLPNTPFVPNTPRIIQQRSEDYFDLELARLESDQGVPVGAVASSSNRPAYPLTIGLVIHGLADGLALGVSALSDGESSGSTDLSVIVFMALAIHKGQDDALVQSGH
jgi:zinc transporter 9